MNNSVTRNDARDAVEKALWMTSGWRFDQHEVDAIMAKVDRYASGDTRHTFPVVGVEPFLPVVVPTSAGGEEQRECRVCEKGKPLTAFCRDTKGKDGRKTVCAACDNVRKRTARRAKASIAARTARDGVGLAS